MSKWESKWFDNWSSATVADQIANFLNNDLKAVHPIYIKVGIGKGDNTPTTAVVIYKNLPKAPDRLPLFGGPRWTEFVGSVSEVLNHLNNFDDKVAILSQFAFAKQGSPDRFTAFLLSPQGAE